MSEPEASERELKIYTGPWKGQLLLVCRKCQKKLKRGGKKSRLADFKKLLKKRVQRAKSDVELHVLEVGCLKMCPKDAVTVGTQAQLGRGECCIVRNVSDVDTLIQLSVLEGL